MKATRHFERFNGSGIQGRGVPVPPCSRPADSVPRSPGDQWRPSSGKIVEGATSPDRIDKKRWTGRKRRQARAMQCSSILQGVQILCVDLKRARTRTYVPCAAAPDLIRSRPARCAELGGVVLLRVGQTSMYQQPARVLSTATSCIDSRIRNQAASQVDSCACACYY